MNKILFSARLVPAFKNKLLHPDKYWKNANLDKSRKSSSSSSSSDSSSDSDVELPRKELPKTKNEATLSRLNDLLNQLVENDAIAPKSELKLAKPLNKRVKKQPVEVNANSQSEGKKLVKAIKDVAQEIGGDVKQTESELILKLLKPSEPTAITATNLNDIMKGMKIDREIKTAEKSRADQIRNILQNLQPKSREDVVRRRSAKKIVQVNQTPQRVVQKIDLFGSEPLGIFVNKENLKETTLNKTWRSLFERDLRLAVTHPPANYFQQMILWTEQGKLWKFPIDNEQGIEEEKNVYFAKHVFLEEHLDPWCPTRGPIRHFMELVCVGLSKNPYLTVEAKKAHIEWYKNYFEDKKKLLQEVGAFPVESQSQTTVE